VHGGISLSAGAARAACRRRAVGACLVVAALAAPHAVGLASGDRLPPMPDWQTDATHCAWAWREGGGFGLAPSDPAALGPTATGEVPGPYGASTHGVRYVITDLRCPGYAIFVEEGQERPLFEPRSITRLPSHLPPSETPTETRAQPQ